MSNTIKAIINNRNREITRMQEIILRKHLNADALFGVMRTGFAGIRDYRTGNITHTLTDTLMAGFAVFSLKDPSLLAFDERRFTGPHNLMTIYGMGSIPCDTSMREILDGIDPNDLRPLFKDAFRQLQRGKILEKMVFMEGCYLLNLDGTGYFSSDSRHSNACLEKKNKKTGKITYYLQTVGAAVVHPDYKEVVVFPPETIRKQDGEKKMDCERNAVRRFLVKLRQDHPHLQLIVNEDGLLCQKRSKKPDGSHTHCVYKCFALHYIDGIVCQFDSSGVKASFRSVLMPSRERLRELHLHYNTDSDHQIGSLSSKNGYYWNVYDEKTAG